MVTSELAVYENCPFLEIIMILRLCGENAMQLTHKCCIVPHEVTHVVTINNTDDVLTTICKDIQPKHDIYIRPLLESNKYS